MPQMPDLQMPNFELLDQAMDKIRANPENHDQHVWRSVDPTCGTAMCLAGWVDTLAGCTWIGDSDWLVPTAEDPEDVVMRNLEHGDVVSPGQRAQRLLRIDDHWADMFFFVADGIDDLEKYVAKLKKVYRYDG